MEESGMMKKKAAALAALALAGVMILTACSSSEQESDQQSAAKNDTIKEGTEVQTEEPLQTVSGTQSVNGTAISTTDGSGSSSDATAAAPAQSESAATAADGTQTAQTSGAASNTSATESESETEEDDIWSGTYVTDDETLTIAMTGDTQISFAFAEAGISGVADVRGSQAVYKGDDHYVIVFNINGTLVDVSVSSEEDYDASDSPLIGTYVKDTEE